MQDLVRNAVGEMRRYYSRKVIDVLIRVTRQSLDALRRRFAQHSGNIKSKIYLSSTFDDKIVDYQANTPVFLLHATLLIPKVTVLPSLEEIQEALILSGRFITSVSKGVAQWSGGKPPKVCRRKEFSSFSFLLYFFLISCVLTY